MRLRLALSLGEDNALAEQNGRATVVSSDLNHYLSRLLAVGQIEDAQSGHLLAGSAALQPILNSQPLLLAPEQVRPWLDNWAQASAEHIAQALAVSRA